MTAPASQRVVVTGCGALSPLGMTAANSSPASRPGAPASAASRARCRSACR